MTYDVPAIGLMALLGLIIGSFLNVVIHRLPIMIEQSWAEATADATPSMGLAFPASHCPHCKHPIAWYDNLPVLSFLLLRGRCRHCHTPIAWQYPLIELSTAALFAWSAHAHPQWESALAWSAFSAMLLSLAVIDARTTWLPDDLTQPLTWGGLVAAALGWSGIPLTTALAGAVAGYLCLWSVYWVFLLLTRKEGMGHGDFKLLAALGAWFGWHALLAIVLIASVSALLFALVQLLLKTLPENRQIPFGPYLALAGAWLLFFGIPPFLSI